MAKVYMDGLPVSGTASYASNVNCLDKDGNQSTVQAELDGLQDKADEQNKNLGFDLLWSNSDMSNSFDSCTLNLDLSKYKMVMIITKFVNKSSMDRRNHRFFTDFVPKDIRMNIGGVWDFNVYRSVTVTNNSIFIGNGYTMQKFNSQDASVQDNQYGIPYQIYGIK